MITCTVRQSVVPAARSAATFGSRVSTASVWATKWFGAHRREVHRRRHLRGGAGEPGDHRVPGIGVSLLSLTDPQPQQRRDRRQPLRHQHRLLPLTRLDRTDQEIRRGFFEHMFG
jgi:hypothetical protein